MDNIQAFLHYGYIPDSDVPLPESLRLFFSGQLSEDVYNCSENELIRIGSESLRKSFEDTLGRDHNKTHIVPLSQGLDSRTILVNLLEHLDRSKIIAVTFGYPDSCVFRVSRSIAKKANVRWEFLDLSEGNFFWSTDKLINSARLCERPTRIFDSVINHAIPLKYGTDCVYWSGLMGDSLSRINPISYLADTWEQAKTVFTTKNCISKYKKLTAGNFSPAKCLPAEPYTEKTRLDYFSQLNFSIRQQCYTRHIYSPRGYDIRYPFLNNKWVGLILNVQTGNRFHQSLYRKIQRKTWPRFFNKWNSPYRDARRIKKLFILGSVYTMHNAVRKVFNGLNVEFPNRELNYIDWQYASYFQDDFNKVLYTNVMDLSSRNILQWLDINSLMKLHQKEQINLIRELIVLAALEIHLKANTITQTNMSPKAFNQL
jgi:hypothetical protein